MFQTPESLVLSFQDCFLEDEGKLVAPLKDTNVIHAVVASLQHESPFCVAAAAGALGWLAQVPGGGEAYIQTSGAGPALLNVIDRSPPPGNLEKATGLFRWYALEQKLIFAVLRTYMCVGLGQWGRGVVCSVPL